MNKSEVFKFMEDTYIQRKNIEQKEFNEFISRRLERYNNDKDNIKTPER